MHPANDIDLFRTSKLDRADARHLQRLQRAGALVRVRHGVYAPRGSWEELDPRSRHLVRMRAAVPLLRAGSVFGIDSAAAVHGVPRLDAWPDRVHAFVPSLEQDLHRVGLTLHAGRPEVDPRRFHGISFTTLAQTVVETGRRGSLAAAVVGMDHALRLGVDRGDLERLAAAAGPWGGVRLEHALELCDVRHESVGESFFAVRAAELGCPEMEPQHEFTGPDGTVDRVDFWLPRQGIVIEFDGRQKYEDSDMLDGRSGADVLWSEKLREDRLRARAEVRGFVRVLWTHLVHPERLRALLRNHDVPCR